MMKLITFLVSQLATIDKTHDRITAAYQLWATLYDCWVRVRGKLPAPVPAPAAPAPEPVAVPEPSPVASAPRPFPWPAVAPAPAPESAPLPDDAYNAEGAEALRCEEFNAQIEADQQ